MLRHKPKYTYKGLTIIMSNPSRFDTKELLSGAAGFKFNQRCLQPEVNRHQCDIRLIDDESPLLDGTKCVLLMGEKAHHKYTGATTTLDENRGSPILVNNLPTISTYSAQDSCDSKNYEKFLNTAYQSVEEFLSEEIAAGEIYESKGRGRTARSNYAWWLQQDTKKALRIVNNGGTLPSEHFPEPAYIINPPASVLIQTLRSHKNDHFYFDIETDFETLDIRCIAISFRSDPEIVYIFQVLDIFYRPYYDEIAEILTAFAVCVRDNISVAHNGALFDFLVFAIKLHIPIGRRVYDTMIAQHRCYPDIEKSLGHCISLYTYLPYHKNEGVHTYRNGQQADQLMYYCGKDVYGMMLVHEGQMRIARQDAGLLASIEQANRAVRPFLVMTYTGMRYNDSARKVWVKENDRLMEHYLSFMRYLHGGDIEALISNKKCVEYFHNRLGYKVVGRTKSGAPAMDEKALLQLKLKYPENVVIDILLKYRSKKKETGTLCFRPWIAPSVVELVDEMADTDDDSEKTVELV